MLFRSMRHLTAAALISAGLTVPAFAETPADTLVIADTIDDIVSLDPAESFEFSGQDALNNVYDRLIQIRPANNFALEPGLAESWSVSDDGKTYTFKMKEGLKFHSGNPITAEDAAWSLQRVVKLNKTPSFILTQFGFTPENVDEMIKATGADRVHHHHRQGLRAVLLLQHPDRDRRLRRRQEGRDGARGERRLRLRVAEDQLGRLRPLHAARRGRPTDSIVLEAVDGYWGGDVALKRVFVRHVPETADAAARWSSRATPTSRAACRRTTPQAIAGNAELQLFEEQRGRIYYLGANQKNEPLAKPQVVEALRYLIDYDGMASSLPEGPVRRAPVASCRPASSARSRTSPTSSTWRRRRSFWPRPAIRTASTSRSRCATSSPPSTSRRPSRTRWRRPASGSRSSAAPAPRSSTPTAPARTS